jgi:hypothetical protein
MPLDKDDLFLVYRPSDGENYKTSFENLKADILGELHTEINSMIWVAAAPTLPNQITGAPTPSLSPRDWDSIISLTLGPGNDVSRFQSGDTVILRNQTQSHSGTYTVNAVDTLNNTIGVVYERDTGGDIDAGDLFSLVAFSALAPVVQIGPNPPEPADQGNLWWNDDDGRLYIYYDDGNTSQWVDASPSGGGGGTDLQQGDLLFVDGRNAITSTTDFSGLNIGLQSEIADAANTYNFYAKGDAHNYFRGSLAVGQDFESQENPLSSASTNQVQVQTSQVLICQSGTETGFAGLHINRTGSTAVNTNFTRFYSLGNLVGAIQLDSANTVRLWTGPSDYRLKENIVDLPSAVDKIKALRPVNFVFKNAPDEPHVGFIAHEVQEVIPFAAEGVKDAVDENGQIIPQSINQDKLIPYLTKALQEVIAKNEKLEARLAALEGGNN